MEGQDNAGYLVEWREEGRKKGQVDEQGDVGCSVKWREGGRKRVLGGSVVWMEKRRGCCCGGWRDKVERGRAWRGKRGSE